MSRRRWYVLHTKSRFENKVLDRLNQKGAEVFLPRHLVLSRRRDRRKMIWVPLFPGYLFVRTPPTPAAHVAVLKTAGAVRLIGNNSEPIPVADATVDSLRILSEARQPLVTGTRFRRGQPVIVMNGPLAGVRGEFVRYRNNARVVVRLSLLGQHTATEVDGADLAPLTENFS